MSRIDDAINAKKAKRSQLEDLGVMVHPYKFDKTHTLEQCLSAKNQSVQTAGRVTSYRAHGKVIFMDLSDHSGSIQIMVKKQTDQSIFKVAKLIDSGDHIGVEGSITHTKTGEITIEVSSLTVLSKALRPIPSKWNAAEDKEVRFRKRYLDMLVNPQTKTVLNARWLILKEIRRYLQDQHNFVEVETPVLQPLYGGTNAKPFTTHMNALDCDFYLRLAPELYLKRLVVGGYEKIFEIARNFRNEGIDQTHQPEFTMIEWYEAYADYHRMMEVAEGLIHHLVDKLYGSQTIQIEDKKIDISGNWPKLTMKEALQKFVQIDFDQQSDTQITDLLKQNNIDLIGEFTRGKAMFALFDNLVTPYLIQPTWIIDYPRDVSPLSKKHRLDPTLAERFEGYIGGKELADGWSEIVDSIDQRNIFENEQKRMRAGDDEAHPLDEDFLESMEYGMPPLGGIGIGIDRLVMFLTNTWSIKEVIAFPTLKPLNPIKPASSKSEDQTKNTTAENVQLPSRKLAEDLLAKFIKNDNLKHHCHMVAKAMESYAKHLGEDAELWYQAGLLHDLDWEKYPDEHPNYALANLLSDYPEELKQAVASHAPGRTGVEPNSTLDRYLFACDELSGFMHAASLMRPNGFSDMKPKSIKKKLKDVSFAKNVSREDIYHGVELINSSLDDHISFLIEVFGQDN